MAGVGMTDDRKPLAERMFESGFTDLIPVIPPGASLAPTSKVSPSSIGKIPGKRHENGLWVGFHNWRGGPAATQQDVRTWQRWGANIGLRSDRFPGVDIDCSDPELASIIESAAQARLGPAPVRIGNPPKRLLPYRTSTPFGRMRLYLTKHKQTYLVEILGQGQQYLVAGTHPTTMRAYEWSEDPASLGVSGLTEISLDDAKGFLDYLATAVDLLGYTTKRIGEGALVDRTIGDQPSLIAPSIDELRKAVALIPNDDEFPGWDEYIKMLHAIRAAAGPDEEDGFDIFAEWRMRRNNGEGPSTPGEDPRSLWRRTHGPFLIGWGWIADLARQHGYNDATFPTEGEAPDPSPAGGVHRAPYLSDQWLALRVVEETHGVLRYVPALEKWLVWNRGRWQPDAEMLAEDTVKLELRKIGKWLEGQGGNAKEQKAAEKEARNVCSAGKCTAVRQLVQSDRAIAVSPESLDFNSWLLNTPGGIVDLKTGKLLKPDPDELMTKSTSVTPDFETPAPEWTRYLDEATKGDKQLQAYLQRLCGYVLTGDTREHQYTFMYGPGGNGKGLFLGVLRGVLGDYATDSPMETFIASGSERHSTELAGLQGARLVTASETDAGKRWDEPKLKRMTGGDPITARYMRQDFFTYTPQFKLVFIGNNRPLIHNLDRAMRRRTHLVPFDVIPKVEDQLLKEKLREEWPSILAWMIEGCLTWQKIGLQPPPAVLDATEEYFSDSDPIGQWIKESCEAVDVWTDALELFDSWRQWANRRGEYTGKIQRLSEVLRQRGYKTQQHHRTRRVQFQGLKIVNRQDPVEALLK